MFELDEFQTMKTLMVAHNKENPNIKRNIIVQKNDGSAALIRLVNLEDHIPGAERITFFIESGKRGEKKTITEYEMVMCG